MSVSEPQAARTQDGVESELKGKEKKKKTISQDITKGGKLPSSTIPLILLAC